MPEIDLIEKMLEKVDIKLDTIIRETNEFKCGIQQNLNTLSNRVDVNEVKVKGIENVLNKPFKERVLDMLMSGVIYSISACIGISVFFLILKSMGGNILTILKPLLSAFVGV